MASLRDVVYYPDPASKTRIIECILLSGDQRKINNLITVLEAFDIKVSFYENQQGEQTA